MKTHEKGKFILGSDLTHLPLKVVVENLTLPLNKLGIVFELEMGREKSELVLEDELTPGENKYLTRVVARVLADTLINLWKAKLEPQTQRSETYNCEVK